MKLVVRFTLGVFSAWLLFTGCSKKQDPAPVQPEPTPIPLSVISTTLNGTSVFGDANYNYPVNLVAKIRLNNAVDRSAVAGSVSITSNGTVVAVNYSYENGDSTIVLTPTAPLKYLNRFTLYADNTLKSVKKGALTNALNIGFATELDPADKFPQISDDALLDSVQKRTFRYFWDFAHPVSGLARERNTSGDVVTTGGSGFGIMAIPVAISRNFITRAQGLERMQTIVGFLKNTADKYHGAFPHWLNGATGKTVAFSTKDNGADLVETSLLVAGLLTARQYFDGAGTAETNLRTDINSIWNAVEWNWFRNGNQQVLYWHWSPNYNWDMNLKIQGWNECLITYLLAASSNTDSIPSTVYHNGFAKSGAIVTGNTYYNLNVPLGNPMASPLFFTHYSFLGVDPNGLKDRYADYQQQVVNHSRVHYEYCKQNPKGYLGYGANCWGLTASDIPNGYSANHPNNDIGVISPTAALSSFPYTPTESMAALKFFYYKLGDKIWGTYGFADAFKLQDQWFASSTLAIDQGPIIVMIENHRTKLVWNLLGSCPELKRGMRNLGFTAPYL